MNFSGAQSETRDHGRQIISSVEAVFEFGEVSGDMLAVDGTVSPCDGGLDDLVRAPGVGDAGETLKAIADDRAVWIEAALGEPYDRACAEAGDTAQLQANRLSLGGRLDSRDERRLARRPSASLSA